jgi:hypothetical protein
MGAAARPFFLLRRGGVEVSDLRSHSESKTTAQGTARQRRGERETSPREFAHPPAFSIMPSAPTSFLSPAPQTRSGRGLTEDREGREEKGLSAAREQLVLAGEARAGAQPSLGHSRLERGAPRRAVRFRSRKKKNWFGHKGAHRVSARPGRNQPSLGNSQAAVQSEPGHRRAEGGASRRVALPEGAGGLARTRGVEIFAARKGLGILQYKMTPRGGGGR